MKPILNLTELDDSQASETLERLRDLFLQGESNRLERLEKDEKNNRLFNNEIWTPEDLSFFEKLDITPYQFAVQRPLINNLVARQRRQPFTFDVVPRDIQSYERARKGRDEFVQNNIDEFNSIEEAEKYYDEYADDEYTKAVSAMLQNTRYESKAKYTESTNFQQGLVSGLDFLKCIYSRKYNREGGIEITRRPQRAMIYDESSVEYDLSDIEYIGEVHLLYKTQLINQYPDYKEEIEEYYKNYTTLDRREISRLDKQWKNFYQFTYGENRHSDKATIAELWYLESEERFKIIDQELKEEHIAIYGLSEEDILDSLKTKLVLELQEKVEQGDAEAENILMQEDIESHIDTLVQERFLINTTYEPIWYKAVFSFNALLEYERSPLPHGCHPYTPFFAQFSEGNFRGIMEDISDVIIAINKALAFRELMMAHGAKGLVVVDESTLIQSGYEIDDIADAWSRIGSVIALKLKAGKRINDVFQSITTVGQGLEAINAVLADLDNRLYTISGVNLAQLGIVQRETPAAGYQMQLAEGEANNGLIFDNFVRSLETFYNDKVVPLVVQYMKLKKTSVIRMLGEKRSPWLEIDFDERFELFEQAVRKGEYNTVITPREDNPRIGAERAARYMQMAMAGMIHPEVALEFSDDPDRFKIIKRNKEKMRQSADEQAAMQVSMQMIQQIMMESGVNVETAQEIVRKLHLSKIKEMAEEKGKQNQQAAGAMGGANVEAMANQTNASRQRELQSYE